MLDPDWYCYMCHEMWKLAHGLKAAVESPRRIHLVDDVDINEFLKVEIAGAEEWLREISNAYHYRCGDWGEPRQRRYYCQILYLPRIIKFGINFNEFSQSLDWREVQEDYRRLKDGQP